MTRKGIKAMHATLVNARRPNFDVDCVSSTQLRMTRIRSSIWRLESAPPQPKIAELSESTARRETRSAPKPAATTPAMSSGRAAGKEVSPRCWHSVRRRAKAAQAHTQTKTNTEIAIH